MGSKDVELCKAERHRLGISQWCALPTRHGGPHWVNTDYLPFAWEGDDREPAAQEQGDK